MTGDRTAPDEHRRLQDRVDQLERQLAAAAPDDDPRDGDGPATGRPAQQVGIGQASGDRA